MVNYLDRSNADFTCKVCRIYVMSQCVVSGVNHRNHCPHCLHSRHLDLYQAGDRLCACKGMMAPVGLTMKKTFDKYKGDASGELMLVHHCLDCGVCSINRIAADDDPFKLLAIFENSLLGSTSFMYPEKLRDIEVLKEDDWHKLQYRLFGNLCEANSEFVCV